MAQVALAWILSKEQISAPIVGTTSLNNLKELVRTYRKADYHRIFLSPCCRGGPHHAH
jgi:predicted oxidoreductase